jgi:hypothetical protein
VFDLAKSPRRTRPPLSRPPDARKGSVRTQIDRKRPPQSPLCPPGRSSTSRGRGRGEGGTRPALAGQPGARKGSVRIQNDRKRPPQSPLCPQRRPPTCPGRVRGEGQTADRPLPSPPATDRTATQGPAPPGHVTCPLRHKADPVPSVGRARALAAARTRPAGRTTAPRPDPNPSSLGSPPPPPPSGPATPSFRPGQGRQREGAGAEGRERRPPGQGKVQSRRRAQARSPSPPKGPLLSQHPSSPGARFPPPPVGQSGRTGGDGKGRPGRGQPGKAGFGLHRLARGHVRPRATFASLNASSCVGHARGQEGAWLRGCLRSRFATDVSSLRSGRPTGLPSPR